MRMAMITDKYSYEYYHSLELQVKRLALSLCEARTASEVRPGGLIGLCDFSVSVGNLGWVHRILSLALDSGAAVASVLFSQPV